MNNTFQTKNLTSLIDLKAIVMGIILISFFRAANNTSTSAIGQDDSKTSGCTDTAGVTISHLPNQTRPIGYNVKLSNPSPDDDLGKKI